MAAIVAAIELAWPQTQPRYPSGPHRCDGGSQDVGGRSRSPPSGPAMVTGRCRHERGIMTERSEFMATVRPPGSRARMGVRGRSPRGSMTERSEFMATVRPPGSRARMGCGGAAPEET